MSGQSYKLVSWVNHNYLKEIQCGIQTAHAAKVIEQTAWKSKHYAEWSNNDVIVILRGGGHSYLKELHDLLEQVAYAFTTVYNVEELPVGIFFEPELNFAATSASLIIPDEHREIWRHEYKSIRPGKGTLENIKNTANYISANNQCKKVTTKRELYDFLVQFGYWLDSCKTV